MSAGHAIVIIAGGSPAPTYYGACQTNPSSHGPHNLGAFFVSSPTSGFAQLGSARGATPVGMSLSGGGLLVANPGRYRIRGFLSLTDDRSDFVSCSIIAAAGSTILATSPFQGAPSSGASQLKGSGHVDTTAILAANALVRLSLWQTFVNGSPLSGYGWLTVESMF